MSRAPRAVRHQFGAALGKTGPASQGARLAARWADRVAAALAVLQLGPQYVRGLIDSNDAPQTGQVVAPRGVVPLWAWSRHRFEQYRRRWQPGATLTTAPQSAQVNDRRRARPRARCCSARRATYSGWARRNAATRHASECQRRAGPLLGVSGAPQPTHGPGMRSGLRRVMGGRPGGCIVCRAYAFRGPVQTKIALGTRSLRPPPLQNGALRLHTYADSARSRTRTRLRCRRSVCGRAGSCAQRFYADPGASSSSFGLRGPGPSGWEGQAGVRAAHRSRLLYRRRSCGMRGRPRRLDGA
jgi:hypothetical protein